MSQAALDLIDRPERPPGTGRRFAARALEALLWTVLALALAYFVGTADWVGAAIVLALLGAVVLLVIDPKLTAILWMVGQPTIFVFANNVTAGIPFFTVERGLFALLLGLMIANGLVRAGTARPLTRLEWTILAFLAILVLSFATTVPTKELRVIRSDLALLVQCYLMPWLSVLIARRMDWSERDVMRFLRLLTLTGLFLVAVGLLQYVLRVPWFTPRNLEVIHEGRIKGPFSNAVEYGSLLGALAILTLAQFIFVRDALFKAVLLGAMGAMVGATILSMSRSPLVGVMAALLFLFVIDPRVRGLLTVGGIVGLVGAAIAIPLVMDVEALLLRFEEIEPIYNRIALLATAMQMILAHPLIGVGFGRYGFSDNKTEYLTGFGPVSAQWAADIGIPHLEYVHIAVLTGLIGCTLYLAALWACFRALRSVYRSAAATPFARTVALYSAAVLITLVVNGLFVDFMAYNYFAALAYFLVGVSSAMRPEPIPAQTG